jgi:glycosyltransferase involved in cell wall biosynthesis
MNVLMLIATDSVNGPLRGLFQLNEGAKHSNVGFVLGLFLRRPAVTTQAIKEALRRGFCVATLIEKRQYDPWLIPQAWRVVCEHKATLLQSHGYKPAVLAWCLKGFTGLPWVAFAHGYTSENFRMALYNRLDRWLMRRADRVVAVSEATALMLLNVGVLGDKIRVIHNAIDPEDHQLEVSGTEFRRQCGAGPGNLFIGVIGRLSPEKGQAVFLQAFEEVVRTVPQARAVLVGEGQELKRLRASVRTAGLDSRITFAGYQEDMSSVYAALDLVVIPSLSEGLPNVLLEAFLHGKAVIATKVGGIPEVMQDGLSKFLVPAGDSKAMAEAIVQVLRDPLLRTELGEAGARRVREAFSPSQRTKRITDLYNELVGTT